MKIEYLILDIEEMRNFAKAFAQSVNDKLCCYLSGDLGTGKTTLVQCILKELGITDTINSPTFTILEHYNNNSIDIFHIDLYRINSPNELEYCGISDLKQDQALFFIEWAENGNGFIPQADIIVNIDIKNQARYLTLVEQSKKGSKLLSELSRNVSKNISEFNLS